MAPCLACVLPLAGADERRAAVAGLPAVAAIGVALEGIGDEGLRSGHQAGQQQQCPENMSLMAMHDERGQDERCVLLML